MAKKKKEPKTVTLKDDIRIMFGGNMIDTPQGIWYQPGVFIEVPKKTEVDFVKKSDNGKAYTVKLDFDDFAIGFTVRKEVFKPLKGEETKEAGEVDEKESGLKMTLDEGEGEDLVE